MGWVFLEILAALAIAIAIVWWIFPKKTKSEGEDGKDLDGDDNR